MTLEELLIERDKILRTASGNLEEVRSGEDAIRFRGPEHAHNALALIDAEIARLTGTASPMCTFARVNRG
jgi:hypothetical protein